MKEQLEIVKKEFEALNITSLDELEKVRISYLGKKGKITELLSELKNVSKDSVKELGSLINELKREITEKLDNQKKQLEEEKLNSLLDSEKIDITLNGTFRKIGSPNPIEKVILELEEVFISLGFTVVEGPEVECDLYNFEMLNLPIGHPARDEQDTFYITDSMLLRSQTSPVQIRTMLANKDKTPIRVVCPGKTYRRDNDDASHSHQFTQMEGLLVDENISLAHLKGTMDLVVKRLFGNVESRFRPSFYPFTEPSVELDISCFRCGGKGCELCKNTGWITVAGAGMVHPNVLTGCGYDTTKYNGFAFGFGLDRLTMLKYGIGDIRVLYTNDLRTDEFSRRDN